jgi:large subunit ribosomal protein L29
MKAKDMRNKSEKELVKDLAELKSQLASVAVDYRTKEVKNIKQIKTIKRDIARVMTVLGENSKGETK